MLDLALAVGDLLQPVPRSHGVLRQAKYAFEERFAEITRGDVRTDNGQGSLYAIRVLRRTAVSRDALFW